jgi:hypothetical protein
MVDFLGIFFKIQFLLQRHCFNTKLMQFLQKLHNISMSFQHCFSIVSTLVEPMSTYHRNDKCSDFNIKTLSFYHWSDCYRTGVETALFFLKYIICLNDAVLTSSH